MKTIKNVLMVCMGNICRSPSAEAVFRHKVKQHGLNINVDSAGTIGAHAREKPDHRAQKAGMAKGYDFSGIKARKVTKDDFNKFDLILAMDNQNIRDLQKIASAEQMKKVKLLMSYAPNAEESEVPDPYYGGAQGFNYVLELIEQACDGLIAQIKAQ